MSRETRAALRRFINRLVALDADRWHHLTMQMAWVYRTDGARRAPPIILAGFGGEVPDKETWAQLRREVNAGRKASRVQERRYVERTRREHRKVYMRKYMRDYRKRSAHV